MCISECDAFSSCLQERKSSRREMGADGMPFSNCGRNEKRIGEGSTRGPISHLILSSPLGTNPGSGHGEFCIENNSVPGLFGNVAVDGDLHSRGEM